MKTIVEIEWDEPQYQAWLCAENIETALSAYCVNTKFKVREYAAQNAAGQDDGFRSGAEKCTCLKTHPDYCPVHAA